MHSLVVTALLFNLSICLGPRVVQRGNLEHRKGGRNMPYSAEVSRSNPGCFLFLIDQSSSMEESMGGQAGRRKMDGVADAINRLLDNLVQRCSKGEDVRSYFDVGVIRYCTEAGGDPQVGPAFSGPLAGRPLVSISEVAEHPARIEDRSTKVEDGAGGLVNETRRFPIWFDPVAQGGTPMARAMDLAQDVLRDWVGQHPDSFPPVVINITDGEANDQDAMYFDPESYAQALRALSTSDGELLLFNIHLSTVAVSPVAFPGEESGLPGDYAQKLFRMSSSLPEAFLQEGRNQGLDLSDSARGFVFNADMSMLVQFMDLGTRPGNLR